MATTPVTINLDTDKVSAEVRAYIDSKVAALVAEVERMRPIVLAAISWRESYGNTSPDHAAACDALMAAVDEMGEVAW